MNDLAFEHYWGTLRTVPEAITVDDEVISNMCVAFEQHMDCVCSHTFSTLASLIAFA